MGGSGGMARPARQDGAGAKDELSTAEPYPQPVRRELGRELSFGLSDHTLHSLLNKPQQSKFLANISRNGAVRRLSTGGAAVTLVDSSRLRYRSLILASLRMYVDRSRFTDGKSA